MDQENKEPIGGEPSLSQSMAPPVRPTGNVKWYAIIVVLIMVISGLAVMTVYHPAGSSTKVILGTDLATLNQPYNLTLQSNGVFKSVTVNWGEGATQTFSYQGSNTITMEHTYSSPGQYYIYYSMDFGSSTVTNQQDLIPVHTSAALSAVSPYVSYGLMQLEKNSTAPLVNNSFIFAPGTNLSFIAGYFSAPADGAHQVIGQTLLVYQNGSLVNEIPLAYAYNMADGQYELSASSSYVNMTFNQGVYALGLQTTTAVPMTTTDAATTVTNTTVVSYNAGQTVTYGNSTQLTYGTTANYTTSPPMLTYVSGAMVKSTGVTNVTYQSANLTYTTTGTELALPLSKAISVAKGTNFTMKGDANVTFLTNGTAKNTTGTFTFNDTTAAYELMNGEYYNFSQGTSFKIVNQSTNQTFKVTAGSNFVYVNGKGVQVTTWSTNSVTYNENSTLTYTNPSTSITYLNATNVTITVDITGVSAPINVGQIDTTQGVYTSTYYYDVMAFPTASQYVSPVGGSTFTSAEVAPGGYTTLDPQIAFYTVDSEILINTMMPLVNFNGSQAGSFVPDVASQVPTASNGGISSNGMNYTFHIRSNLNWQDGTPVTVYDAYYALVRLMLFTNAQPLTGSYLLANYLLPAPFYDSVSYQNITSAITYSNATQNLTLHFQQAMSPTVVFQLIAASEADPIDANWLIAHGAGIQFTPSGFQNYTAQGNLADYNTYVQNHVMADGPYQISYNLPGSQIVLVANSNFVSPGSWDPVPTIKTVSIQYLSQPSTAFLELKSGAAQSAVGIPATPYWPQIKQLASGANPSLQIKEFPTLGIYFYNFNVNTNMTLLHTMVHNANMPGNLFVNPNARKAFDYAYNYSEYLNVQIGNALYNTTFAQSFVGMLPPGMLYNQSIAQLKAAGINFHNENGTANANFSEAHMYWNWAMNGTDPNARDNLTTMGIKYTNGIATYDGSPLVIPIFVPIGDSPDTAGATTWASVMEKVIPGASFPVESVSYTQIFATFALPGGNPMPISWGGWAPDYVYPTDYELSMSLPTNLSTYMNPAGFNPWYINGGNSSSASPFYNPNYNHTEANIMNQSLRAYNNATSNSTSNPAKAEYWFHQVNYYIINETMNVNLYQVNFFWTISSKINGNDILNYQENLMVGAGNELTYNLLSYNTTAP
ncbi:MAG: ABC transporter substrate-binding protein [Candidatus Thermoplasmatota archaeon]|nr:ABC transporter substrate-binding protein [Candidatus Thermoplasmatota archaeon]